MPFTFDHLIVFGLVGAIMLTTWLIGLLMGSHQERLSWLRRFRR